MYFTTTQKHFVISSFTLNVFIMISKTNSEINVGNVKEHIRQATVSQEIKGVATRNCAMAERAVEEAAQGHGVEKTKRRTRIDAADVTQPEDHPYAVMLFLYSGTSDYLGLCSGALVSLEWVITAASHCFSLADISHVVVYAGGNSQQEWLDQDFPEGAQTRNSSEFHVHPNYTRVTLHQDVSYYDLALVKVGTLTESRTVAPLPVYTKAKQEQGYVSCSVTGFGRDRFYKESREDFTRKTYYLEVERPCRCFSNKPKPKTWFCSRPKADFGICGSDWGAALVCDGKIRGVAVLVISYKNLDKCLRDDYREYTCATANSISVFQWLFPCVRWMNTHLERYQVVPLGDVASSNNAHFLLSLHCSLYIFYAVSVLYFSTLQNKNV